MECRDKFASFRTILIIQGNEVNAAAGLLDIGQSRMSRPWQEEGSPSERARGSGWLTVEIKRTCWHGCGSGLEEIKWVETIATLWLRFATTMRIKSQTVKWGYTRNGKRNERCIHSSYSVWLWGYAQPRVNVLCGGYSTRVVRARNCRNIFLSTR